MDKKDAALDAMRASMTAVEGQLREAETLKAAEARARRSAERKVGRRLCTPSFAFRGLAMQAHPHGKA